MSDHLPECGYKPCNCGYEDDPRGNWAGHLRCSHVPCICAALRACEQRVRKEESRKVIGSVSLAAIGEANVQQYQRGYVAGLDAAREAVVAVEPWHTQALLLKREDALAAIDALKEKP